VFNLENLVPFSKCVNRPKLKKPNNYIYFNFADCEKKKDALMNYSLEYDSFFMKDIMQARLILETCMQVQNRQKMSFNNTRQKFKVPFQVVSNVSNLNVIPT
jgi:hypothetical protein